MIHENLRCFSKLVRIQVPARYKIDLVCLLEEKDTVHHILSAVLMEGGCQAIDQLASNVSVYAYLYTCKCVHANIVPVLGVFTLPFSQIQEIWRNF